MPDQHQLDMFEAHIGAEPGVGVIGRGFQAFGRAGLFECMKGRKMRLAEKGCLIAVAAKAAGKSLRSDLGGQVDAIVVDAVGAA